MVDRTSPAYVLASQITQLEWEIESVLAKCSNGERSTVEVLRNRLTALKRAAENGSPPGLALRR